VRKELSSAEEQLNKCQNQNRTKMKMRLETTFFNLTFSYFIFGKKKLKKPTSKLACQFDNINWFIHKKRSTYFRI